MRSSRSPKLMRLKCEYESYDFMKLWIFINIKRNCVVHKLYHLVFHNQPAVTGFGKNDFFGWKTGFSLRSLPRHLTTVLFTNEFSLHLQFYYHIVLARNVFFSSFFNYFFFIAKHIRQHYIIGRLYRHIDHNCGSFEFWNATPILTVAVPPQCVFSDLNI